jgi:hypothetical protein
MPITEPPKPPSPPLGSSSPDNLEKVLQRIHDNVYSRPLLSNQTNLLPDYSKQMDSPLIPPFPTDLLEKITLIRNAQAPYYVVSGNPLTKIIKRFHNLVLKLFGRKQAYYNNLTLDVLENMVAYLHVLQEHHKAQSSRIEALTRQVLLQTEQFAALQMDYQKRIGMEQIASRQDEGRELEEQVKQPAPEQNEK